MEQFTDKPTVVFLDYFEKPEEAVPLIGKVCEGLKGRVIIVSTNFDMHRLVKYAHCEIVYFDRLLSKEDYDFMDQSALNLTRDWYSGLKPVEGVTEYQGIPFGAMVEEMTQRFFASVIQKTELVIKLMERFRPGKVILIGRAEIFKNLSLLIKERFAVPSIFIESGEKRISFSRILKKVRQGTLNVAAAVCDSLMRRSVFGKKADNGILVDARLYFELKDLRRHFHPYLYLIEKGLRVRLRLLKDEGLLFAPPLTAKLFKLSDIFSPFYRNWQRIRKEADLQNRFSYKGLPLWGIMERFIAELLIDNFCWIKKNMLFFEKLYKVLQPKVVVLRIAVREQERVMVVMAEKAGIPTLVLQDGILAERGVYTRIHSRKVAVWGRAGVEWYGAYGNDTAKCVVSGKPRHDLLHLKREGLKQEQRRRLLLEMGADPGKETILYLAGFFKRPRHYNVYYPPDLEYMSFQAVLKLAESLPEKQLILKMHPFDLAGLGQVAGSEAKNYHNIFVIKNADTTELIRSSSLVIVSLFSSAALDAVILDKPLITLNFQKREDLIPFAARGVAFAAVRPEELPRIVRQVFEDRRARESMAVNRPGFIHDYAYKVDGHSGERTLNLIRELYEETADTID